jgi:hypothetical protein
MSNESGAAEQWIAVATCASTLVAGAALIFLINQVEYARTEFASHKTEQKSEKTEQLWREWASPAMLFARARTAGQYPMTKGSPYQTDVLTFFERAARFQQNGIVAEDDLDYYFHYYIVGYWCALHPWIEQNRKDRGDSTLWNGFERIVTDLERIERTGCMSPSETKGFMQIEQDRYKAFKMAVATGS